MTALILSALFAQTIDLPYAEMIRDPRRLASFVAAQNALEKDRSLLDQHRAIAAFLETEPTLQGAEDAYRELLRVAAFRRVVSAFDEALRASPADRARFDRYQKALLDNRDLRRKIDALHRIEMRETRADRDFGEALRYLKTHPGAAVDFLNHPARRLPTPEALSSLRDRFRRDTDLQAELRGLFEELNLDAAAHADVYPWWAAAFDEGTDLGRANGALHAYLLSSPGRFWVWDRRHAAWAARSPGERAWIDQFYAQIRRDNGLQHGYFDYLETLQLYPALRDGIERRWNDMVGPPEAWPPHGRPPELSRWNDTESISRPHKPVRPARESILPERPTRPDASGLREPVRPTRPRPVAPNPPLRGRPPERAGATP